MTTPTHPTAADVLPALSFTFVEFNERRAMRGIPA